MDNLQLSSKRREIYDIFYGTLTCLSIFLDDEHIEDKFNDLVPGNFKFFTREFIIDNICTLLTNSDYNRFMGVYPDRMPLVEGNIFRYRLHSARVDIMNHNATALTKKLIVSIRNADAAFINDLLTILNDLDAQTIFYVRKLINVLVPPTMAQFVAPTADMHTYYECDDDSSCSSHNDNESDHSNDSPAEKLEECFKHLARCNIV